VAQVITLFVGKIRKQLLYLAGESE